MRIGRDMKGNFGDLQGTSAHSKRTRPWWLGVRFSAGAETYLSHRTHTVHSGTQSHIQLATWILSPIIKQTWRPTKHRALLANLALSQHNTIFRKIKATCLGQKLLAIIRQNEKNSEMGILYNCISGQFLKYRYTMYPVVYSSTWAGWWLIILVTTCNR